MMHRNVRTFDPRMVLVENLRRNVVPRAPKPHHWPPDDLAQDLVRSANLFLYLLS